MSNKLLMAGAALIWLVLVTAISIYASTVDNAPTNNGITSEAAITSTERTTLHTEIISAETTTFITTCDTETMYASLGEYTLTAYCPCVICCDIWSAEHKSRQGTDYVQTTASGLPLKAGETIAVDPDIIPYGTTVLINGHEYTAADKGGAIKGKCIDIYFETHQEACDFGKQTSEIFILNGRGNDELVN